MSDLVLEPSATHRGRWEVGFWAAVVRGNVVPFLGGNMAVRQESTKRFRRLATVGAIASGLLASAPASSAPLLQFVAYDQAKIDRDKDRCAGRAGFAGPNEIQDCDDRAMEAEIKAASKSSANAQFRAFLPELFEPLLFKITGGEDVLAERVVVTGVFTELAGLRAQILNGQNPQLQPGKLAFARGGTFSWLSDRAKAADLQSRWAKIKAGDCAAYPVPNCDQRLEQALQQALTAALSEAQPSR